MWPDDESLEGGTMTRIQVWPMPIEPRNEMIILGGTKQDRSRALFCMLLPDDGSCYTAAEVVKRVFPVADSKEYRAHAKALYDLANDKGITGKREGDPGPDNVDARGKLLLGKRGHRQRPRWNARSWQAIISDEIWTWLVALNDELIQRSEEHRLQGYAVRLFCDLETFQISEERAEPLHPPMAEMLAEIPPPPMVEPAKVREPGAAQAAKKLRAPTWLLMIGMASFILALSWEFTRREPDSSQMKTTTNKQKGGPWGYYGDGHILQLGYGHYLPLLM